MWLGSNGQWQSEWLGAIGQGQMSSGRVSDWDKCAVPEDAKHQEVHVIKVTLLKWPEINGYVS